MLALLQLQSASLTACLLTTDAEILLLQLAHGFLVVFEGSLSYAQVVDLAQLLLTLAIVDLL